MLAEQAVGLILSDAIFGGLLGYNKTYRVSPKSQKPAFLSVLFDNMATPNSTQEAHCLYI